MHFSRGYSNESTRPQLISTDVFVITVNSFSPLCHRTMKFSTGKMARLADGAIVAEVNMTYVKINSLMCFLLLGYRSFICDWCKLWLQASTHQSLMKLYGSRTYNRALYHSYHLRLLECQSPASGGGGGQGGGRKGSGRCTGGGRRGGGKQEKKGKITQHCAIFCNRKNAKGREPKNTGREAGGSNPPVPPHHQPRPVKMSKWRIEDTPGQGCQNNPKNSLEFCHVNTMKCLRFV